MEPGLTSIATEASRGILQSDPVLGGICILLAVSLLGLLLWHFRETGRLNGEMIDQERGFRKEMSAVTAEVTKGLDTIKQVTALLSARDK